IHIDRYAGQPQESPTQAKHHLPPRAKRTQGAPSKLYTAEVWRRFAEPLLKEDKQPTCESRLPAGAENTRMAGMVVDRGGQVVTFPTLDLLSGRSLLPRADF